jgi:hypothetical protein
MNGQHDVCKNKQRNISLIKQTVNISKENVEDYKLAMFTHAMNLFKECANLKWSIPEHFFTSLLSDLSIQDLVTLGNLLPTKFMKPKKNYIQFQVGEPRCHNN